MKCKINGSVEPTKEHCFTVVLINEVSAFFSKMKNMHKASFPNTVHPGLSFALEEKNFFCFFLNGVFFSRFINLNEPRTCVWSLSGLNQLTIIDRLIWSHARLFVHVKSIQILKWKKWCIFFDPIVFFRLRWNKAFDKTIIYGPFKCLFLEIKSLF